MRIVFALTHTNFLVQMDPALRSLVERGHEVVVFLDEEANRKFEGRFDFSPQAQPYPVGFMRPRDGLRWKLASGLRELINYLSYFVREPVSKRLALRWRGALGPLATLLVARKKIRKQLTRPASLSLLRWLERRVPTSRSIDRHLRELRPDAVVVALPLLPHSLEHEYLSSALHLGIPAGVVIPSWDNLTSKGVFHRIPDRLWVWNHAQVREAEELHGIPRGRTDTTGAPRYDRWFGMKPSCSREDFAARAGLKPEKPFVAYLFSSTFIAPDETSLVKDLVRELRELAGDRELPVQLLVRPHLHHLSEWENVDLGGGAAVWPRPGDLEHVDLEQMNQDFYDTLFHCRGVLGVNTSAFLEAAVVDRPCIAVDSRSQDDVPHFQLLRDGGFLEVVDDAPAILGVLEGLAQGRDRLARERRAFVGSFLRPGGLEHSASLKLAGAIEEWANAANG